jgi:hypothetical protein
MPADDFDAVSIQARVGLITAFGMFDVPSRRFFVPTSMLPGNSKFNRGDNVMLKLTRAYARQEGLIA